MKSKTLPMLLLVAAICAPTATRAQGQINFPSIQPTMVLDFYQHLTGRKLIVSKNVAHAVTDVSIQAEGSAEKMIRVLQDELRKQAGVIIVHYGDNEASVTYNEKLDPEADETRTPVSIPHDFSVRPTRRPRPPSKATPKPLSTEHKNRMEEMRRKLGEAFRKSRPKQTDAPDRKAPEKKDTSPPIERAP